MRMWARPRAALPALLLTAFFGAGCLMPAQGTPVYVDSRAGSFWSGKGQLTEVSEDQERCKVSVRDRALVVQTLWVDCRWLHARRSR
jgi:hypothetical protein